MKRQPMLLIFLGLLSACSPLASVERPRPTQVTQAAMPQIGQASGSLSTSAASGKVPPNATAPVPSATPAVISGSGALPTPEVTVLPPTLPAETPTPTVAAITIRPLTQNGCCVQPFWSPDSQQVLFIDRPDPQSPAGIWGVPLTGGQPALWSERLGIYSPDLALLAYPARGATVVERLADRQRWTINNGGRSLSFAPDSRRVAWTAGQSGPPFDTAVRQVWVSAVDGTQARRVIDLVGGSFLGWLPDGRLLISSRLPAPESGQVISALTLPAEPGAPPVQQELVRGERLGSFSVSPGGSWLAYVVSFTADPSQSGLWLVNTTGGQPQRIAAFGSFRWRDDGRLLLVPLDLDHDRHSLLQIDAAGAAITTLIEPTQPDFKIANGDWSVSPDGQWLVFLSANDQNLWLVTLPR